MKNLIRISRYCLLALVLMSGTTSAQWTQVGPGAVTITNLVLSETGMMYAGGFGQGPVGIGVYRSSDHGEHWSVCTTGLPLASGKPGNVYNLTVNHDTVLVCYYTSGAGAKLYRSLNAGDTWAAFGTGLTNIDNLYQTPGAWFGTFNSYIFRSTDFGATWSPSDTIPNGLRPGKIIYNNGVVFNDTYQSTDFGVTWTTRPGGNDLSYGTSIVVWNGDTLYATGYPSLSRSTNNGQSWQALAGPFQLSRITRAGSKLFGMNNSNTATIYSSEYPFDTWNEVVNDLPGDRDLGFGAFVYDNGTIFMSVGRKGIYRSDDMGLHWRTSNAGLAVDRFSSPCIATDGKIVLIGGSGDLVFRSKDEGATWLQSSRGLAGAATCIALRESIALAGGNSGVTLHRSTDGGQTWTGLFGQVSGLTMGVMFIGNGLDTVIAAGYSNMYRSVDKGIHYTALTTSFTYPPSGRLFELDGNLYAGTANNTGEGELYKSTDRGTSWTRVAPDSLKYTITGITSLGHSLIVSSGYAWTTGVIRRSDDGGATWYRIMGALNPTGYTTGATNVFGSLVAQGTNSIGGRRMYSSNNGGGAWNEINEGLPTNFTRAVSTVATNNYVLLALDASGIYRRAKADFLTAVEPNGPEVAREFALAQNYPNPFNPTTKISFSLANASVVTLSVYDNLGREVAALLTNALTQAGNHDVTFDATTLASGVYYYRLTTQSTGTSGAGSRAITSTGKMLLVR